AVIDQFATGAVSARERADFLRRRLCPPRTTSTPRLKDTGHPRARTSASPTSGYRALNCWGVSSAMDESPSSTPSGLRTSGERILQVCAPQHRPLGANFLQ